MNMKRINKMSDVMRVIALLFAVLAGLSCAGRQKALNEPQIIKKAEGYTSPNQKIEVELLVQKSETSRPGSSLSRGKLKAGSIVAQHVHAESDEFLSFKRGAGELTIAGETHFVKDGDAFYIPKGVEHSYVNRSSKDAVFHQVYTPGGPEQRFKKWSRLKRR